MGGVGGVRAGRLVRVVRRLRALAVCGAVLAGAGGAALPARAAAAPVAGLAYHGSVFMASGRVDVRLTPYNGGPSAVPEATVRLRWSQPLADRQRLPERCVRSGAEAVLCRVEALAADGLGERIALRVRLLGTPSEVLLEIDTVWSGGAVDRNRREERQRVLVLDTGDDYYV